MSMIALPDAGCRHAGPPRRHREGSSRLVGAASVIADDDGRRAFETDGLTAYRCMPLAVVLPRSTEDVGKALRYCSQNKHQGGARGRRHVAVRRRAAGRGRHRHRRLEDEPGARRRLSEPHRAGRGRHHQPRHLARPSAPKGFFYAPDPSSQLACTLAGNIAMNSGGAHCLKYGVTTNNVLGLKMVLIDGASSRSAATISISRATICWG